MRRIGRVDVFVQRFWNGRQCTLSERLGEVIRACRKAVAEFPQLSTFNHQSCCGTRAGPGANSRVASSVQSDPGVDPGVSVTCRRTPRPRARAGAADKAVQSQRANQRASQMSAYANVARLQVGTSGETDGTELGNSAVEKAAPGAPPSGDAAGNAYLSGRSLLDFDPETRRSMIHFFSAKPNRSARSGPVPPASALPSPSAANGSIASAIMR